MRVVASFSMLTFLALPKSLTSNCRVNAEFVHDRGAAGEDRDVLQHFLAASPKPAA